MFPLLSDLPIRHLYFMNTTQHIAVDSGKHIRITVGNSLQKSYVSNYS